MSHWNLILIISPLVCSREDFQRIPELAINPLGDRIINAFFPEGWVVPVVGLLCMEILFLRALGLSHNHHKSERGFSVVAARLQTQEAQSPLPILCLKKISWGFWPPLVLSVYLAVVRLFISLKVENQMFFRCIIKIPKRYMCRRLNFSRGF